MFDTKSGATPSSGVEEYWDGNINWVTPEDVGKLVGRYIQNTRRRISEEGYKNCGVNLAPAKSLVLTKRAPIGQIAILSVEAACNQGCFLLTKQKGVDERFYYYTLVHLRPLLEILGRGSTFMELSADDLRSVQLPYLKYDTQCLIADYLDRETARIDALVAEKEKMLALLEEKRAALISRAVTRGLNPDTPMKPSGLDWLGEIPEHWEVTHFKYVCDLNPKVDLSKLNENDEVTFLPMDKIKSGYYIENIEPFLKYNSSYNPFAEGDIVIAKVTPCFENGNIAIAEKLRNQIGFGSSEIFVIRPSSAQRRFIFFYLQSDYFKQQGEASMTGAGGLKRVSPEFVQNHFIAMPPEEEQAAIAEFLDQRICRMREVGKTVKKTISLLKERRAALITAAVTGQIPLEEMRA